MIPILTNSEWLPVIFWGLMGMAILVYVILDGYDLGIGMLMANASATEKDIMIASIGPFWDANETWLVLGIAILLVAFPAAYGVILTALYLPVAMMLIGLILRGVAFDFRAKAKAHHKALWDKIFTVGSLITAVSQGILLGLYVMGCEASLGGLAFALCVGIFLGAGYAFIGAAWLFIKTEADLQKKALIWIKRYLWFTAVGIGVVSIITPLVSNVSFFLLLPFPILTFGMVLWLNRFLKTLPRTNDQYAWVPFTGGAGLFLLAFLGLAYSFYPYIVPGQITIWQSVSASESLSMVLIGALIVLPVIVGYTIYSYRVFWGKVKTLRYD